MPEKIQKETKVLSQNLFPVVGIGASAGGLEAFKKFIKAVPPNSGMAYILVQHLHPDHISSLPEILQRETSIPVQEISDNVKVQPDKIFIIPTNKMLVANDGILKLSPRVKDKKNMPIDLFFSSLAEIHQNHAIGIILSGTGADGTAGLKRIKDEGGITFAQEMESAAFDEMPHNAIKNEVVDFILAPEAMPHRLLELERTFSKFTENGDSTDGKISEEDAFRQILALIRIRNGTDFNYYKQTTIRRRILRRLAVLKQETLSDYLSFLHHNKAEVDILFQELLIPVTSFFRDEQTFEHICKVVFPSILKQKNSTNPLRVWVAGCSTGEEAYSLGICLYEYLADKIASIKIQIFATDLSFQSITKARAGIYNARQLGNISDERLQQFFTKKDGSYEIKKAIRDMCVFATHNFLKDPPFAKVDLISCRNVLIYMEPFLQKKALTTFHYALNEKSYLLLGRSETTGGTSELFMPADKKDKLYIRKSIHGKFMNVTSSKNEEVMKDKDYGLRSSERKKDDYQKNADDILLAQYTPPGVIVNEQFDIVQFRGSTGPYLEPSPGKASLNILKMARDGLSFELRSALHKAKSSSAPFIKEGIFLDKTKRRVTIQVVPLLETIEPHFLILFTDAAEEKVANVVNDTIQKQQDDNRITLLEKDLRQARKDMKSITEDQEAANEELQSANEELLSGSEELQSLNEELETSKEELQSTNEELITVNQELFDRNAQLNQLRVYNEGIITTIHEPLLVLTPDFKIRSANKSFYETFRLTEKETLGNTIFSLRNNGWNIPHLREQLQRILLKKETFLEWETTYHFPAMGERIIYINAQLIPEEKGMQLILLALDDITLRKEAENIQYLTNLRTLLQFIPQITFSAAADGSFTYFNDFFFEYSSLSQARALKDGFVPIINPAQTEGFMEAWEHSMQTFEDVNIEIQLKRNKDGYRWHLCRASAIVNDTGSVQSWVGFATDIERQKTLEKAKDEFISVASHELKTPLTSAKAFLQLIEHKMEEKKDEDIVYARKAGSSIDRLSELVSELLDVSKIQHGMLGLKVITFDFNALVAEAVEEARLAAPDHTFQLTGSIEKSVQGDRERLKQVLNNLLTNAVKYSPEKGTVAIEIISQHDNVMVSVKDNGMGVRKKNINKIFDRYFRDETQKKYIPGLGIGLSISKEITLRHKGKIWAESEPGKGAIFYFTVPLIQS